LDRVSVNVADRSVHVKCLRAQAQLCNKYSIEGFNVHSIQCRSYDDDFTGQMTQPTVS